MGRQKSAHDQPDWRFHDRRPRAAQGLPTLVRASLALRPARPTVPPKQDLGERTGWMARLRLRHRRRGLGRLRAGQPAERGPAVRVALIEAGGRDSNPWIHIPAGYYRNFSNPAVTWQFGSGPEPHLDGRIVPWPRGRVLGGSSAINGLLYVRGQAQDYDVWRQLGNVGWSLRGRAALLQARRGPGARRRRLSRHRRAARRLRRAPEPATSCARPSSRPARRPASRTHDDFNGAEQEGAGYYPAHQPQRPALLGRGRLPAPGALAPQPAASSPTRWCTAWSSTASAPPACALPRDGRSRDDRGARAR